MLLLSPDFGGFRSGEPEAHRIGKFALVDMIMDNTNKVKVEGKLVELKDDKVYVHLYEDDSPFIFEVIKV